MLAAVGAALILIVTVNGAEAHSRHHHHHYHHHHHHYSSSSHHSHHAGSFAGASEASLLPHPSGCPARAFCGCGAALEVYGHNVRDLWLAANWLRFPHATPAPGMVALRRHHVFVIREVRAQGLVLAYDANSGGGQTRLHLRSLAGFTVVDPHRGRASL